MREVVYDPALLERLADQGLATCLQKRDLQSLPSTVICRDDKWLLSNMTEHAAEHKVQGSAKSAMARQELDKIAQLLLLPHGETLLDIHMHLSDGLRVRSLQHLIGTLSALSEDEALAAIGVSRRTVLRRGKSPHKPLSPEQSGRAFKFAEVLAKATDVFGSQEEAEAWLTRPATGLHRQRPIDLLGTPAGAELVTTFLGRLEYGVFT